MKKKKKIKDFPQWLGEVSPEWRWDWRHLRLIQEKLAGVTRGELTRLMIFLPPRHGKTELVTIRYAAWRLENAPGMNLILGCYNQRLANRFSRKIRKIAAERIPLATDKKAVEEWETGAGGGLRAVGVGAGVTGHGGNLIVIDDPVKSRKEAESRTFRERIWDWFNDDLYTRLEPGAAIVLIQTRWHDDDLAGRLLAEMEEGGEAWEVVCLPALAEDRDALGRAPGEALCPERYDEEALGRIRRKLGAYSFAALYQQRPVPVEGALFKRDWFKYADRAPEDLQWARGYDLAVSVKTSADYTASFRCAFDAQGNLFIADGFRKRIEYPEQRRYVVKRMVAEKNTQHGIEKALHGQAFVQDLRQMPAVRGVPLRAVRVDADKYTRALSWANLAEEGKVYLVKGNWVGDFLDEACRFTGKGDSHDDQVDAISLAVQMLGNKGKKLVSW
jgi:predicted phage terminase large subunit-like protein